MKPNPISRFGPQAGEIRTNPSANRFRPNPARPLVSYFAMNIVAGALLAWAIMTWGSSPELQPHPVEIVIKAAPGVNTADITEAIGALNRRDIHMQSFESMIHQAPSSPWPLVLTLIIACFFLSAPFFFIFSVAYWVISKFD